MTNNFNWSEVCVGVLGSTGSVGVQALDVVRAHKIKLDFISANRDVDKIEAQIREFQPRAVAMADTSAAADLAVRIADTDTKVYSGKNGILDMIHESNATCVVNAILGVAGLRPTIAILESGKRCALSNKESLVCAGPAVNAIAKKFNAEIIPVDSEHSAIFQSIGATDKKLIKKLLLTASGGPFFGYSKEQLSKVTKADALAHPTWKMGAKITVDSASLMNKGFEVIEAVHLFNVKPKDVEVVVHRESIIHSMVEYIDNTVIAELSAPDMSLCVQYAITHPHRTTSVTPSLDFTQLSALTFHKPDLETFPLLALAYKAAESNSPAPCAMNAANEIAVASFLNDSISFDKMVECVIDTTERFISREALYDVDALFEVDAEARELACKFVN